MTDELDDILNDLKKDPMLRDAAREQKRLNQELKQDLKEEDINQYILNKASLLVENGLDSVQTLKDIITQSIDAEEIEAYSSLIKAVNNSLETVNRINLQNKKAKVAKEIKQMEVEAKKQLGPVQHNTNVLIATREEIIKGLIDSSKQPKPVNDVIDADG